MLQVTYLLISFNDCTCSMIVDFDPHKDALRSLLYLLVASNYEVKRVFEEGLPGGGGDCAWHRSEPALV